MKAEDKCLRVRGLLIKNKMKNIKTEISKAVIKKDGKYLLLKRAPHSKNFPKMWDFAGGKHNLGETSLESVVRETKEETNIDIKPGEEIKTEEYNNGKYELIFHYFIPSAMLGELKLSNDHSDFIWVSKEKLMNFKLHPSVKLFFN